MIKREDLVMLFIMLGYKTITRSGITFFNPQLNKKYHLSKCKRTATGISLFGALRHLTYEQLHAELTGE